MNGKYFMLNRRGVLVICALLMFAVLMVPVSAGVSQSTVAQGDRCMSTVRLPAHSR